MPTLAELPSNPRAYFRAACVTALAASALVLLVTSDTFAHGTLFAFPGWLGVLIGLTGIAGGAFGLATRPISLILLRWHAGLGIAFVPVYSLLDPAIARNPGLLALTLVWVAILGLLALPRVHHLLYPHAEGPAYLRLHWSLIVLAVVAVLGLAVIWVFDWEGDLGLFGRPNGNGVSTFVSEESSPRVSVAVSGGFVYRLSDRASAGAESGTEGLLGEVVVKLTSPDARISFVGFEPGTVRVTLLNLAPSGARVRLDGAEVTPRPTEATEARRREVASAATPDPAQVNSREFLEAPKGSWLDVTIAPERETVLTVAPAEPDDEVRAFVLSDLHSGYTVSYPVLMDLAREEADFIVFNGDTVNNGYLSEYVVAAAVAEQELVPVYTTLGNHDVWSRGDRVYRDYFGPTRSAFTLGRTRLIFLDTASGYLGNDQIDWLEQELLSADASATVVFSHMPPIDLATGRWDDRSVSHPELRHSIHSRAESNRLVALLGKYGVDAYIAGHTHQHGDTVVRGVRYVTSGALGGTVNEGDSVSYLELVVRDGEVRIDSIDVRDVEDVANREVANGLQAARVFVTPFITTRSLRVTLTLVWLLALNMLGALLSRWLVVRPGPALHAEAWEGGEEPGG